MPIDLRSDTLTVPTSAMRDAMYRAEVGDDVWGEDPTVQRLEAMGAAMVGKEASVFMPSGTMGNQAAAMTHLTQRGMEVIVEAESHMFYYEVGGLAVLSGAHVRVVAGDRGRLAPADIVAAIREPNVHMPVTGLLCLENTHNRAGGAVLTAAATDELCAVAHAAGVPVHLDGARVFNAAIALGLPVTDLTRSVDSVMFCLSKGLGAPVGSLLAGSSEFVLRARRNRKLLGGGMRQVGIIASAGIVALESMITRLADDHKVAKDIAAGISLIPSIDLDVHSVQTNIVIACVERTGLGADRFCTELAHEGVLASSFGPTLVRFVTHKDIPVDSAQQVVSAVGRVCAKAQATA